MPKITIDGRTIEVPPGETILDAARRLGMDIPTLCHMDGCEPSTSCLVCVVRLRGSSRFVPSCAVRAVDGMEVESETAEVHAVRRAALELLLGDHVGDCLAPCQLACPAHMDIPLMLRQIRDGRFDEAIATIKRDIALPAVLGRLCAKPCEKACRRGVADEPVAICRLKALVAEADLASKSPYAPPCKPDSTRRIALVGAGASGLAAAFYLRRAGHHVAIFEKQTRPGGRMREQCGPAGLAEELLDAEIRQILRLGPQVRLGAPIETKAAFDALRADFDAVLVCCGTESKGLAGVWDLDAADRGIAVEKGTFRANLDGVFAAGSASRGPTPVVRSIADGKEAAAAIDAFLSGTAEAAETRFTVRMGRLTPEEVRVLIDQAGAAPGVSSALLAGDAEAVRAWAQREAARCMHCDCRARHDCRLRIHSARYDAQPTRFQGTRREPVILRSHAGVLFDSGKCIDCGLCVQILSRQRDVLGLAFVGRGFDVRLSVPFDRSLDEALGELAAKCVAACPTAALAWVEDKER